MCQCSRKQEKLESAYLSCSLYFCSRPAPLLKNVQLSESKARELYMQVIEYMRRMYQDARLVHADLSEFNMLWVGSPWEPPQVPSDPLGTWTKSQSQKSSEFSVFKLSSTGSQGRTCLVASVTGLTALITGREKDFGYFLFPSLVSHSGSFPYPLHSLC